MKGIKILRNVTMAAAFGLILPSTSGLAGEPQVTRQLAPGVEVVNFTYKLAKHKMLKKYRKGADKDKPVLVFDITLKNTSDRPARYQAFMLMPKEGKSTGGIIPRSTKKIVKPGDEASETYAALLNEIPETITLVVNKVK